MSGLRGYVPIVMSNRTEGKTSETFPALSVPEKAAG
jgi:hypothetical protein